MKILYCIHGTPTNTYTVSHKTLNVWKVKIIHTNTLTLQSWHVPVPINHTSIKTSVLTCNVSSWYALVLVQLFVRLCPPTWHTSLSQILWPYFVCLCETVRHRYDRLTDRLVQKYRNTRNASRAWLYQTSSIHFSKRHSYVTGHSSIYNNLMDSPIWSRSAKLQQRNWTTYSI